jgi:hypothetical protein
MRALKLRLTECSERGVRPGSLPGRRILGLRLLAYHNFHCREGVSQDPLRRNCEHQAGHDSKTDQEERMRQNKLNHMPAQVDDQAVYSVWILQFNFTQTATGITPVEDSP